MRRSLMSIAAATTLTLALVACGGDEDDDPGTPTAPPAPSPTFAPPPEPGPPEHGWDGHAQVDFGTGDIEAEGFNELIDAESPDWAQDPVSTASVLLRLDEAEGTVEVDEQTDNGEPVVVVTVADLPDGSVEAMRYRIVLRAGDDGLHRFAGGDASWRCQPERGHQDFDTEPCA